MGEHGDAIRRQVGALFDETAASYDQVVPFFSAFGEKLAAWAGLAAGQAVLDVATDRGALISPTLERIGPAGRPLAVDLARGMVARTAADVRRRGLTNVTVARLDAEALALPTGGVDVALCGFAMHLLPHPERAYREIRRVPKPGGAFALSVPGPVPGDRWRFYGDLIAEFGPQVDPERPSLPAPPPPASLPREAGFVTIASAAAAVHVPVADPAAFWAGEMSHGMRGFVEAMPVAARLAFKRRLIEHLDRMHGRGGIVLDRGALFYRGRKPFEPVAE